MKIIKKLASKTLLVISVLIVMVVAVFRISQAADLDRNRPDSQVQVIFPVQLGQIQISTPTPIEVDLDEVSPIQSEVGRDVGLVIGAAILLFIVFAGLLIGQLHSSSSKPRD